MILMAEVLETSGMSGRFGHISEIGRLFVTSKIVLEEYLVTENTYSVISVVKGYSVPIM